MPESPNERLAYIDWMRGLACVLMFQTHCYDSWLGGAARQSPFFKLSQLGGTLPAPLFLFLAGISVALVTDRMRRKGASASRIARKIVIRGAEILGLGLLFRGQEFLLAWGHAPWTDLFRVDILNIIGISIMLLGFLGRWANSRRSAASWACVVAAAIALATPPLWTTWKPDWLPWYLESYINGVHIYGTPQPWLFPIFPWAAFAFAGLAAGCLITSTWAVGRRGRIALLFGALGVAIFFSALWFDARPVQLYAVYDFWHTSPNFFLARVAVLLMVLCASCAWCRWGLGTVARGLLGRGGSAIAAIRGPLVQMGQTSLIVYWVHIEFVYGSLSILHKRAQTIPRASLGLLTIFLAMLLLSVLRTRWKARGPELAALARRLAGRSQEPMTSG